MVVLEHVSEHRCSVWQEKITGFNVRLRAVSSGGSLRVLDET